MLNWFDILLSLSGSRTSNGDGCMFHPKPRASDLKPTENSKISKLRQYGMQSNKKFVHDRSLSSDNLHPDDRISVLRENLHCEFVYWMFERDSELLPLCTGRARRTRRSLPLVLQGMPKKLVSFHEVRGGILMPTDGAEIHIPLGLHTDVPNMFSDVYPGWPSFSLHDSLLWYTGLLPNKCSCVKAHEKVHKMSACGRVLAVNAVILGGTHWLHCFRAHFLQSDPGTLRDGSDGDAVSLVFSSLSLAVPLDFVGFPSFASWSSSLHARVLAFGRIHTRGFTRK